MSRIDNNLTGIQAELFVQYRLARQGYIFHRVSDCSYDLIGEINKQLIRVQVKGRAIKTKCSSSRKYTFTLRHGNTPRNYTQCEFDVMALVALPMEAIYWTLNFSSHQGRTITAKKFNEDWELKTFNRCLHEIMENRDVYV